MKHVIDRWCVYNTDGIALPEPIGDSEEDAITCFCALSEMSREQFFADGYIARLAPAIN